MDNSTSNSTLKILAACLAVVAGGMWAWARVETATAPPPTPRAVAVAPPAANGGTSPAADGAPGPRSPEQMREMLRTELGLSDEQAAQMKKAMEEEGPPRNPIEFQQRFQKMREILTPEQQKKMRSVMMNRMLNHPQSPVRNLSPEEREKFAAKLEQRMESGEMLGIGPPPGARPPQ